MVRCSHQSIGWVGPPGGSRGKTGIFLTISHSGWNCLVSPSLWLSPLSLCPSSCDLFSVCLLCSPLRTRHLIYALASISGSLVMFTKILLPNRVMSMSDRYMCLGSPLGPLQLLCGKWSWGTTKSKVTDESRDHGRWGVKMC